jgi:hypothetical protein
MKVLGILAVFVSLGLGFSWWVSRDRAVSTVETTATAPKAAVVTIGEAEARGDVPEGALPPGELPAARNGGPFTPPAAGAWGGGGGSMTGGAPPGAPPTEPAMAGEGGYGVPGSDVPPPPPPPVGFEGRSADGDLEPPPGSLEMHEFSDIPPPPPPRFAEDSYENHPGVDGGYGERVPPSYPGDPAYGEPEPD